MLHFAGQHQTTKHVLIEVAIRCVASVHPTSIPITTPISSHLSSKTSTHCKLHARKYTCWYKYETDSLNIEEVFTQGHLTEAQSAAMSAVRAAFPDSGRFCSDHDMLRFLRARNFDVEATEALFWKYCHVVHSLRLLDLTSLTHLWQFQKTSEVSIHVPASSVVI